MLKLVTLADQTQSNSSNDDITLVCFFLSYSQRNPNRDNNLYKK